MTTMTNATKLLAAGAAAAAALGALSAPATAGTQRTSDPAADVMRVTGPSGDDRCGSACEAFERPEVDIASGARRYDDGGLPAGHLRGLRAGVLVRLGDRPGTTFTLSLAARSRRRSGSTGPSSTTAIPILATASAPLDPVDRTYRLTAHPGCSTSARALTTGADAAHRADRYTT